MATRQRLLSLLVLGLVLSGLRFVGSVARTTDPDRKPSDAPALAFLAQHCTECHAGNKPKGGFRLDSLTQDFSNKTNRQRWLAVSEQLRTGAMPPRGKPRPSAKDVTTLTDWIRGRVETAEEIGRAHV